MRKIFVTLLLSLVVGMSLFSQETTEAVPLLNDEKPIVHKRHEVRLNLLTAVFGFYPEFSYDYIFRQDMSFGASLGVALGGDYFAARYSLLPHFRWYFGRNSRLNVKRGSGFFIETNLVAYSQWNTDKQPSSEVFMLGAGFALGWKFLSFSNWVGEIRAGAGRSIPMANNQNINSNLSYFYPVLGIYIGKRF